MTKFKTWLSLCLKILKKSHNLYNNPEEKQIKISRVFMCTDAYTSTSGGGGGEGGRNHINIYRLQKTFF